jgi:hypothetical protein
MPTKFRGKVFNDNVFEKYMKTLPSTKENSLIKSAIFKNVSKYRAKMSEQAGGYFITEPIKGRIGGEPVNYDGQTNITSNERDTFYQTKIAIGRANAWGEDDFVTELTGENFMAEAQEIKDYWDGELQKIVLSMLKGIFGMTNNEDFANKHTYEVEGNLTADALNRASQKALGDKKKNLSVVFMHSAVSTNLEGLNLIEFLKYTDKDGIERDLTIGTYNGKLVIVDDDMPVEEVEAGEGTETVYTSYMFENGFFEIENVGVKVPSEVVRNATERGGHTDLVSRVRYVIVPKYISYKTKTAKSPLNADLENGSNWEVANNGETSGNKKYVDSKLIPIVRIKSRG